MAVTRAWKVYGNKGRKQGISFEPSITYDWSTDDEVRIIALICSDVTHTNDYVIVQITANNYEACEKELNGQLSDGIFENSKYGKVEEITK